MRILSRISLTLSAGLILANCGGSNSDVSETAPINYTHVVFSPAQSKLPIPMDLMFEQGEGADGTLNAGSDDNPIIQGIDIMDGNSVLAPLDITIDGSLDPNQTLDAASFITLSEAVLPNPNQNIFVLPLTYPGGDALLQAPGEVPTFLEALDYQTAVATGDIETLIELASPSIRAEIISLDGGSNNILRLSPIEPLQPKTKYLVIVSKINDSNGTPIQPSNAYDYLKDPSSDINSFGESAAALNAVRDAIQGWEQLAAGYFSFQQSVFDAAQSGFQATNLNNVALTFTFTTGGTTDVLKAVAAPETFFENSNRITLKQSAISKLVDGTYSLQGPNASQSTTDQAINSTIITLLTSPLINTQPNPLYSETISNAISGGASYTAIAEDASATYIMQRAAAEAAIAIHDSGAIEAGDQAPYIDLTTEAAGTVASIASGRGQQIHNLFPIPAPRTTAFFRFDSASDIFVGLQAPAIIYQGEITLPQLLPAPGDNDPSPLKTGHWTANTTVGEEIDTVSGNTPGTTPPSNVITYRYPIPTTRHETTVPITVTMPDELTLGALGVTKPTDGWPVIIYVHGISGDRSHSLPMANALAFSCINPATNTPSGAPCFATVAIDQPLHGIEPSGSVIPGLYSATDPDNIITPNLPNTPSLELTERHFDYTADAAANPIPMDYAIDFGSSGSLFVNLSDFGNARDNLRQMVVDLLNVNASIDSMDVNADGLANDLDPNNVFMMGISLGGVNGIPFVSVNNSPEVQASPFSQLPKIKAAAVFNTGGGIPRLLTNSVAYAQDILAGLYLASDGAFAQGESALELYLSTYQGVADSVDPINFANSLSDANNDTGIYLTEIIGDGASNLPDQTIPNAADAIWGDQFGPLIMTVDGAELNLNFDLEINGFRAPFAGTAPLIEEFGAIPSELDVDDGDAPVIVSRFQSGTHNTPVAADDIEVFSQMVSEIVTLFASLVEYEND